VSRSLRHQNCAFGSLPYQTELLPSLTLFPLVLLFPHTGVLKQDIRSRKSAVSPARVAAFDILLRVEREHSYASELLHSSAFEHLSPRDHALATELVMGVLRWRSRLDDDIAIVSSQSLSKLDSEILVALRLAVYQFRHLDRIPKHAALSQSVELVKRARKRSAAAFVNAVLRKLTNVTPQPADPPEEEPSSPESLARFYAHPRWIVERWVHEFGLVAAHKICKYDQAVPQTAIRLRTSTADAELTQEGITLVPGNFLAAARRVEAGEITKAEAFRDGHAAIQDEASQLIAALVARNTKTDARFLDCCAAPGGKTLAIADRNPGAAIVAVELHPHRARLLRKLINGAGAPTRIQIIAADARNLPTPGSFDRVLADVPCSGTGTLARNPEIKWRLQPEDLRDLQQRQLAILHSALARVAPGGRLIYSTCSLEREENEDVVEQVLTEDKSFRLIECRDDLERLKVEDELIWPDLNSLTPGPYLRTIPGIHPCDGFFAAVIEKI
jgi:16S rRNA (cytosine967-C5)-methyltransferase